MKKIISLFVMSLIAMNSFAQCCDTIKVETKYYVSAGISVGNSNFSDTINSNKEKFKTTSYPSIEIGFSRKNSSFGVVLGRESMLNSSTPFFELKTSIFYPIGNCSGYAIFGAGAYLTTDKNNLNNFIEYGAGFSYAPCNVGLYIQYSNWANANYVSTGVSYIF